MNASKTTVGREAYTWRAFLHTVVDALDISFISEQIFGAVS